MGKPVKGSVSETIYSAAAQFRGDERSYIELQ